MKSSFVVVKLAGVKRTFAASGRGRFAKSDIEVVFADVDAQGDIAWGSHGWGEQDRGTVTDPVLPLLDPR